MEQQNFQENQGSQDNNSGITPEELINDINADENAAGTTHLNEEVADENAMEQLRAELQEQKDKYLRLFAEFDNFKRRNAKERIELSQTAGKEVISSLLDVLDDSERSEKVMETSSDLQMVKDGVKLVFQKLRNVLEQRGLKPMITIGTEFDADLQEAITEIPAPTPDLAGKVIDEVQKGYLLNDKIIRYAKVVVGK
ncbi:MAG: nucleotide exchange factor GrpE [Bacteroidota bacterium]